MEPQNSRPIDRRRRQISSRDDDDEQSSVYSFRCPKLMDNYISHLMNDHMVNRTQVIRLGVFMLASFSEWEENQGLTLDELVERMAERCPKPFPSFSDFCPH